MAYFEQKLSVDELKSAYRKLVLIYHPDRGGDSETIKAINYEYACHLKKLSFKPSSLSEVREGQSVKVNDALCVVTEVYENCFRARSGKTGREALFSKSTGYAMLNFNLKASLCY
jgi:hypothetical protein